MTSLATILDFGLRMREKIITILANLNESSATIEGAYNAGVVDGFSKELETQISLVG